MFIRYEPCAMSVPLLKSATALKKNSPVRGCRIGTILASVEMNVYYVNETCGVCDFINHAAAFRCALLIRVEMIVLGQMEDCGYLLG